MKTLKFILVLLLVSLIGTVIVSWLENMYGVANVFWISTLIVMIVGIIVIPMLQYFKWKEKRILKENKK